MSSKFAIKLISAIEDDRGSMCVIDDGFLPFKIKRVFYDFDNRSISESRGNHANIYSRFAFICLSGSCDIVLDDGFERKLFLLNDPRQVLLSDRMVWKEMKNFTENSVLLVLSDCEYNENEYIREYDKFIKIAKENIK